MPDPTFLPWTVYIAPNGAAWYFIDADMQDATFLPDTPGQYLVTLAATDQYGAAGYDSITITVADNLPPVAVATVDKTTGPAPLTVQFDGSQSYDPEGKPLKEYFWDFGDGTDSFAAVPPPHTYTMPGTYTVAILAVTDERGAVGSKTFIITVTQPNQPPVADAGPDQNVYTNDIVYLNGNASDAENDTIQWWSWTVIGSPTGSIWSLQYDTYQNAAFTAFSPGTYILTLIVDDGFATSAADTVTITVADNLQPVAVATVDKTEGPAPLTVQFDGSGSYDPEGKPLVQYFWDFGDGTSSYAATPPPHTYTIPGTYTVAILTVSDERWASGTDSIVIQVQEPVNQPPVVAPTATPASGTAPLAVQFAANASDPEGAPLTYAWEFGDSDTSYQASPAHTYTQPGTYIAKVTASDGDKSTSATLTIVVDPAIEFNITRGEIDFKGKGCSSF